MTTSSIPTAHDRLRLWLRDYAHAAVRADTVTRYALEHPAEPLVDDIAETAHAELAELIEELRRQGFDHGEVNLMVALGIDAHRDQQALTVTSIGLDGSGEELWAAESDELGPLGTFPALDPLDAVHAAQGALS